MEVKRHRLARTDTRIHKYAQNACHHTHHSRCASDDGLYVFLFFLFLFFFFFFFC